MKLAIVHDFLNQYGGAERVVGYFLKIFPETPIYTSIYFPDDTFKLFRHERITTTFMQNIPGIRKNYKRLFFLYPYAFRKLKLCDYEIILGSSSSYSHFISKCKNSVHINYCYTPPRFLWETKNYMEGEKVSCLLAAAAKPMISHLRKMDRKQSENIDYYIAISEYVKSKIKKTYDRKSIVIYPPIEIGKYRFKKNKEDFYLIVSRLKGYKKVDIAVKAFNMLGKKLLIVGRGEDEKKLLGIAGKNIQFLGTVSERKLLDLYSRARSLIFTGKEDFGLTPVEAQASGTPVIAYKEGGASETIIDGKTGFFFEMQEPEVLAVAVKRLEKIHLDPVRCRENAERFDFKNFRKKMKDFVQRVYKEKFIY
jgi:glycosyltransferase involved in cell wall biosynthesis